MSKPEIVTRDTDSVQLSSDIMNGDHQAAIQNVSIQEGFSFSYYLQVTDKEYVEANAEGVAQKVSEFINRARKIARASDLPT